MSSQQLPSSFNTTGVGSSSLSSQVSNQDSTVVDDHRERVFFEGYLLREGAAAAAAAAAAATASATTTAAPGAPAAAVASNTASQKNVRKRYVVLKGGKLLAFKNDSRAEPATDINTVVWDFAAQPHCEVKFIGNRQNRRQTTTTRYHATNEVSQPVALTAASEATAASPDTTASSDSAAAAAAPASNTIDQTALFPYRFVIESIDNRTRVILAAQSLELCNEWMKNIRNCIYAESYFYDCTQVHKNSQGPLRSVYRALLSDDCSTLNLQDQKLALDDLLSIANIIKRNRVLIMVSLVNVGLSDASIRALASGLCNSETMQYLDLSFNRIADDGLFDLLDSLYASNVKCLVLSDNLIGDLGAVHLADFLKSNLSVTSVDLSGCNVGAKGAEAVGQALATNSTLRELDLSGNSIGDKGISFISVALKQNKALTKLGLASTSVGTEGVLSLCAGLQENTRIQTVDLRGNSFSKQGSVALAQLIKEHKSIVDIDLGDNPNLGAEDLAVLSEVLKSKFQVQKLVLARVSKPSA